MITPHSTRHTTGTDYHQINSLTRREAMAFPVPDDTYTLLLWRDCGTAAPFHTLHALAVTEAIALADAWVITPQE